jgi:hypothetical protein
VLVDESVLAELRASGQVAMTLANERAQERREALVTAAIGDGRIPPARKDHWLGYLAQDPEGGAQVLAALAPGTVPVQERGHGHSVETLNDQEVEQEAVSDWTHQLFPETRGQVAASGGDLPRHSRIATDGSYRRGR